MKLLETGLPADPLALARRIWDQPEAAVIWSGNGGGPSYVTCQAVETSGELDPEPALSGFGSAADGAPRVPRWLGLLPYEAERSRMERRTAQETVDTRPAPHHVAARWWRYGAVCVVKPGRVQIIGDDAGAVDNLSALLHRSKVTAPERAHLVLTGGSGDAEHRERIRRALDYIREGDIYQVNMARRIDLDVQGDCLSLLAAMGRLSAPPYGVALESAGVVSTSPELFLELGEGGRLLTIPIKGTRPRGMNSDEDAANLASLASSDKEARELTMVIDIERNDLARVSRVGSVRAESPFIEPHPTLFHRQARVSSVLREGVGRAELLRAMLPSGSITGAPKVRAMEIIAELEASRRGLYTGALGFIDYAGGMQLSMAIRTLTVRAGRGHYFVGGGIVAGSQVEEELRETNWKALQITSLV